MKYLWVAFGAVLSGCLLGLALPPFSVAPLGWIALVPLIWTAKNRGFAAGFVAGLVTGFTPAVILANGWVASPYPMAGEPNWIYAGFLIFGLLLGAMAGIVGEQKAFGLRKAALLAAVAVLFEFSLTVALPEHLALTQWQFRPALLLTSFTGIWGVSYWLWFTNLGLASSGDLWRRLAVVGLAWVIVMAPLVLATGKGSLSPSGGLAHPDRNIKLCAVVQSDSQDLDDLAKLNAEASHGDGVVVWPEMSAEVIALNGNTSDLKTLSAKGNEAPFVTTFEDDANPLPHNAAALFSHGKESKRYFKRRPFAGEITRHRPGVEPVEAALDGEEVGLNICFDSCYPNIIRDTADLPGIALIALPTEDPPSRGAVVQSIHAAYTTFRAAELGVTIARADITARSMIVGPRGDILASLGAGPGVASATLSDPIDTFYRRFGDWFVWVCLAGVAGAIVAGLASRRRSDAPESTE